LKPIVVDDLLSPLDLAQKPPTSEEKLRAVKFIRHSFQASLQEGGKPEYFDFDSFVPKLVLAERCLNHREPAP
jgi:hypothetical protein